MRRLVLVPIAALAAVAAAPSGAPAAKAKAYHCGSTSVTVLLWPHGHKAIRSVHFAAAHTPNIQIYRYDPRFAGGNFLLYADARGHIHPVPDFCGSAPARTSGAIAQPTTLKGKRAVTCTVSAVQTFAVTRQAHGVKVVGQLSDQTLFTATVTRNGAAKITFDSSACEVGPAPPPR
jgi:hypothetical protein